MMTWDMIIKDLGSRPTIKGKCMYQNDGCYDCPNKDNKNCPNNQ